VVKINALENTKKQTKEGGQRDPIRKQRNGDNKLSISVSTIHTIYIKIV
jgi:hypothetical protein